MRLALIGEKMNAYRLLVGKPEGNRPLGRPRCRRVDNIWMAILELGRGNVNWIGLAQGRNSWRASCEFGIEPSGSIKCCETIECPNSFVPLKCLELVS
jgi:hypothetical protein